MLLFFGNLMKKSMKSHQSDNYIYCLIYFRALLLLISSLIKEKNRYLLLNSNYYLNFLFVQKI